MPILFYPGQEDYITELNKLAAIAELTVGDKGWSPVIAAVTDGARVVLQVSDWIGGQGAKPAAGQYLTLTGLTNDISQATNVRGASGANGTNGTNGAAATIAVGTVTTGPAGSSASVTNVGTSSAATFNFTIPKGVDGTGAVSTVNSKSPNGAGNVLVTPEDIPVAGFPALRPTLLLDFANSRSVDPRITFTRSSTATYFDAQGVLRTAASGVPRIDHDPVTGECKGLLIEEARTNLLTYSEQLDNAAWVKTNCTVISNAEVAPDGTTTADSAVNTGNVTSLLSRSVAVPASSTNDYYVSIFVKPISPNTRCTVNTYYLGAAETNVNFNFSSKTITGNVPYAGEYIFDALPNGWFRIGYRVAQDATGTKTSFFYRLWQSGRGYTTGGCYVWGTQLEAGTFPTSYIPSSVTFTGRASAGSYFGSDGLLKTAVSGEARMNYNPTNLTVAPKLLLEEASTNLLTYSEQFDNANWEKFGTTVTPNLLVAPDGSLTADKVVESTANSEHYTRNSPVSCTAGTYVASVYWHTSSERSLYLRVVHSGETNATSQVVFYKSTLALGAVTGNAVSASAQNTGNGWWRISLVFSIAATRSVQHGFQIYSTASSYTGDGTSGVCVWGAQLEAGSFPTSYIPTTAAQVTRAADSSTSAETHSAADVAVMTGTNFSSWYRQDEGTFAADGSTFRPYSGILGGQVVSVATDAANRFFITQGSSEKASFTHIVLGSTVAYMETGGAVVNNGRIQVAIAYKVNDFAFTVNGVTPLTDTSGDLPTMTTLYIGGSITGSAAGNLNGHIRRIAYYPFKLSPSQWQALTS